MGSIVFLLATRHTRADDAPDASGANDRRPAVTASLSYVFDRATTWKSLVPDVSMSADRSLGSDPALGHRFFVHYGLDMGQVARPRNRDDLARSLLLPGAPSLVVGAAHGWSSAGGTRVTVPDVGLEAKVVPWRDDTTAYRVALRGGASFSSGGVFDAAIQLERGVNAVGHRDRRRVLAASGGPDLWASDVSATAGLRSIRHDVEVFGELDAYLFDSKFHVPARGRRAFSLGVGRSF
ncbi:MAG TPA: hypothetical protein VGK89_03060 [Candidatus Eisenbacteria bacterium]